MFRTEIRIKGKLTPGWSDWFEDMHMATGSSDETVLCGNLPDMAAVYGVLSRLGSLVMTLHSVTCVEDANA